MTTSAAFEALLCHRVKVHWRAPGATDRYGNRELVDAIVSEELPARFEVPDASELVNDRETQRERFLVFLPPNDSTGAPLELAGADTLEWLDRDVIVELDGDPLEVFDALGRHHFEAWAFRVTG